MFRELKLILFKLFQKFEREKLPTLSYETTITMTPKLDKDVTKKENYRSVSLMYIDAKVLNKVPRN